MPDFAALALTHALCNALAEVRPLYKEEVITCLENWHDLKSEFEPDLDRLARGDPRLKDLQASAYAQWLAWQKENSDLVDEMRRRAVSEVTANETPIY